MVNVILDAKNQSFKLCSVDGIDVVSYWPDSGRIYSFDKGFEQKRICTSETNGAYPINKNGMRNALRNASGRAFEKLKKLRSFWESLGGDFVNCGTIWRVLNKAWNYKKASESFGYFIDSQRAVGFLGAFKAQEKVFKVYHYRELPKHCRILQEVIKAKAL